MGYRSSLHPAASHRHGRRGSPSRWRVVAGVAVSARGGAGGVNPVDTIHAAPTQTAATQSAAARPAKRGSARGSAAQRADLLAQTVTPPAAGTEAPMRLTPVPVLQEVVVSGFRESLAKATAAKRDAIGFTDSIYSEDIGKFADNNIAESFNRVPGITISVTSPGRASISPSAASAPSFHQGAAERCADRGRLDGRDGRAEHQPGSRPQHVPDGALHQPDRREDLLRRHARGRRRRHRQHAQRPSVRSRRGGTSPSAPRAPTTRTPAAGATTST